MIYYYQGGRDMKRDKVFCEHCREDVEYSVLEAVQKGNLKGEEYEFIGKRTICNECSSDVFVAEIEDENLKSLYDSYRKINGIISLEKILEISQKYSIGKRPLSLLLGWGELTFTRYCDGDMPTKQYSDILQRVYDDPEYFKKLLVENKERLKSAATFEKSMKKVLELLKENGETRTKFELIIKYLLYCCEDITPHALQKALYYVQGFYYAFMKAFLFDEDCEAWVHGPVYRDIYKRYAEYQIDPIYKESDFDVSVFNDVEKAIIDSVVQYFCCYSGKVLESFTHSEMPWLKTRDDLPANVNSNRIISKVDIGEYFSAVKEKYNMIRYNDIEEYAKSLFASCLKCC